MDTLSEQGTYQLVIAMRKSNLDLTSLPSDIIYMIYLNVVKYLSHYDAFSLSHILNLLTDPLIQEQVPQAFWDTNIPEALLSALKSFEDHKEELIPGLYF